MSDHSMENEGHETDSVIMSAPFQLIFLSLYFQKLGHRYIPYPQLVRKQSIHLVLPTDYLEE